MEPQRSLDLMTTAEASDAMRCTPQHLRLLIRQGKVKGEKRGRDWFADRASVQAYRASTRDVEQTNPRKVREQRTLFADAEFQPVVNVASVPQRSPFRYPGGKTWLIPVARMWLASFDRKPKSLVEPFAGGGGIGLMAAFEDRVERSLLVELDPDVAAVWRVLLNGHAAELCHRIRTFQCAENEVRNELSLTPQNDLERAFQTIVRNRVSRGGILAPGAGLVKNGEANKGIASRWYPETLARRIENISDQKERIAFQEGDGLKVLDAHAEDEGAVFFIDPPYPVAGKRLYRFHSLDHRQLFKAMNALRGRFLATYDHNPEIEALALEFGFNTKLIPMKSTHHMRKLELLISRDSFDWLEYRTPSGNRS